MRDQRGPNPTESPGHKKAKPRTAKPPQRPEEEQRGGGKGKQGRPTKSGNANRNDLVKMSFGRNPNQHKGQKINTKHKKPH